MLRRSLALVPLLALAAVVLGLLAPPAVSIPVGIALGAAVTAVLGVAVREALRQRFEDLAGERARVQRLLDDLPLAVLLFTRGDLAYANPAAQALFPAAVVGRHVAVVLGDDGLHEVVEEVDETGRPVGLDLSRGEQTLQVRASRTGAGEIAVAVTDLTESRRVEAIRRDFVTNASHELKTPVAGMQALADSLVMAFDRDPHRARRMVDRLTVEAARLAQLVRDLLDLARLEEMTAQRARRVDLGAMVRSQVERLARLAEERGVAIRCDLPADASVVAIPEDVRLIVGNLVENAVLYNRRGGRVDVTVRRQGGEVLLEVADTGMGIPEGDRARVFERFYRVDKGRSRAAGGTGLGLSIVRHAVERHGGAVTLSSRVGEGSRFVVVLPVSGLADSAA